MKQQRATLKKIVRYNQSSLVLQAAIIQEAAVILFLKLLLPESCDYTRTENFFLFFKSLPDLPLLKAIDFHLAETGKNTELLYKFRDLESS